MIPGVNDSKKLTPQARERLFGLLDRTSEVIYGVGIVEPAVIDDVNIYQATILAMWQAVDKLRVPPDYLLIDGMALVHPAIPSLKIVKGDELSVSIAAASIIAKETRDRLMRDYHDQWPHYGFAQHKGYGTEQHLEALQKHGPCPIHRLSFDPIKSRWSEMAIAT